MPLPPPASDELFERRLHALSQQSLLRPRRSDARQRASAAAAALARPLIDLSSNDYLGLGRQPLLTVATSPRAGAGASRLIHGTDPQHDALEGALAGWLGVEDSLLFSSGYAANLGVLSCLPERDDIVLSDALNHASLIDGARLSRARVVVLPHRDVAALRHHLQVFADRTVWFVTEAYFSMDGTAPDLAAVADCLQRHGRAHLILDEAHSLGTFGSAGRGLGHASRSATTATIGTFGKAFGLQGAFVAGSRALCSWLWNRARSFVFSTATSPALAAAVLERLELVRGAESTRARLSQLSAEFHGELSRRAPAHCVPGSSGPIVPYLIGGSAQAVAAAEALVANGVLTQSIRPPTVPQGEARLRFTVHAELSSSELELVLRLLATDTALGASP